MAQMTPGIPSYYQPMIPPRRWGESAEAYQRRIQEFQAPMQRTEAGVRQLIGETEEGSRGTLEEQKAIQAQRLQELSQFLAAEEGRKFNQAIPEIAETAQGQGFLETSGFGNALARERVRLAGDTSARLTEQGLADRDFEVGSLGAIGENKNQLLVGGLERKFSLEDLDRSEALSRELARLGVQAPQKQSQNFFDKYGGLVGAGIGAAGAYYGGPGYAATVNANNQAGNQQSGLFGGK